MKRAGPGQGAATGIVLAHGRGADAADILGLLAAAELSDVAAIAPEAPGHSWWPTPFLAPSAQMEPFVVQGVAAMMAGVAALEAEGIARNRIWLGGFSQGAGLALESFARLGVGLAGVFGFSGGLIGTGDAGGPAMAELYNHRPKRFDYAGRRDGAKAWISVHARDPHIPLKRVEDSATVLRGLGAEVVTRIHPGAGHGVLAEDLAVLRNWLHA